MLYKKPNILLWDNDGTITGSVNPLDSSNQAKIILPHVKETMHATAFNFVISGFKSPESEAQNFDPLKIIDKFITLMDQLPINAVTFSPTIGGMACYALIKKDNTITVEKAHENPSYKNYIGHFKKPDIGMFIVMRDIALNEFGQTITPQDTIMIGDTWHDKQAASTFGIPFLEAKQIHQQLYINYEPFR